MAQLFIAHQINQLLRYWEDCNLCGEFNFQLGLVTKALKAPEGSPDLEALVGSELNRLGLFARSIPEYQNLRKILMGSPYVPKNNFSPRIPKDLREVFGDNLDLFMDHGFVKSPAHIAPFLLKWNETRRACVVEDTVPIPLIDIRNENWLSRLPYESFFLNILSPFVFDDSEGGEWSIDSFLVYQDEHYIRILAWPQETKDIILTDEDRKKLSEGMVALKKGRAPKSGLEDQAAKIFDWFLINLAVSKDSPVVCMPIGKKYQSFHCNIYNKNEWAIGEQRILDRLRTLIEMINGFCKLMATLPPKPSVLIQDSVTVKEKQLPPRQWFELLSQTIDYFHTSKENDTVIIRKGIGSEKSPHVRRAHTRRIVKGDGRVEEIWIEQVTIRADKLVTQQLQGGALKVR